MLYFVFAYKKQPCCLGMQNKIVLSNISFGLAHQCSVLHSFEQGQKAVHWFLFIFIGIIDAVFLFQKILFADKITKFSSNTQKYLHISQKSSTFALDFSIVRWRVAIVAQLVEQRIRNAWVAGSSPASGSKQK